jgi:hypothetical protein
MTKQEIIEKWTQKYKKSIDCSNPKGFSQKAHCQGRKKKLNEDLRRWFKEKWTAQDGSECGDYKGRGRVKCRPSKRVSDKSPETWGEMSPKEKKKAVRLKQKAHREGKQFSSHKSGKTWDGPKNKYKPGKKKMDEAYLAEDDVIHRGETPTEYRSRLLKNIQSGDISSFDNHDRVHGALAFIDSIRDQYEGSARNINLVVAGRGTGEGAKIGFFVRGINPKGQHLLVQPAAKGAASHPRLEEVPIKNLYGLQISSYPNLKTEHRETLRRLMNFRGLGENMEQFRQIIIERHKERRNSDCGCNALQEEKKPYKGFKKGKNHPEGGLSRAEARRQGIHAGIETKDEAKRKGGFGKLSKKTQARRKSFCARMCGMKKRRTSSKTARDPKSKINAALRVWGCRCGTNESFNANSNLIINEGMGRYILKKVSQDEELDKSGNVVKSHLYHIILNQKKVGFIDANLSSKRMKGRLNGKKLPEMDFKNPQARLHGFLKSDRGSEFIKESLELTEGKNKPTNKKLWSRAKALARSKFKVYPSAYANAWASKWYKKRGGGWSSMQSESVMKTVVEEIVNKKHKGTMSKKELSSRDRLAANVKGIRAIKGNDSDKNAKYRYATYVILKKRGEKSSESSGKKKSKSSKKK